MYFKYTDNYEVYENIDYKDIVIINSCFIVESIKSSNFFNSSIKSMTNNIIILCMRYHEMILKNKEVTSLLIIIETFVDFYLLLFISQSENFSKSLNVQYLLSLLLSYFEISNSCKFSLRKKLWIKIICLLCILYSLFFNEQHIQDAILYIFYQSELRNQNILIELFISQTKENCISSILTEKLFLQYFTSQICKENNCNNIGSLIDISLFNNEIIINQLNSYQSNLFTFLILLVDPGDVFEIKIDYYFYPIILKSIVVICEKGKCISDIISFLSIFIKCPPDIFQLPRVH